MMVLKRTFSWKFLKNNSIFFHLSPTLSHFHSLQVENCGSNLRLVVDENDSGKFRLQRVNPSSANILKKHRPKDYQFEIIITLLVSSFPFI